MKKWTTAMAALSVMCAVAVAVAAEVKSGLEVGAKVGAFNVVKSGGAPDDGVAVGKELCYRCKYGNRPQVMIFTRQTNGAVAELTKALESAVVKQSDKQLSAFVNLLGADKAALDSQAKKFATDTGVSHVPVVVPVENENGPDNYGLNPKAEVTVLLVSKGQVKANHAFAAGDFNSSAVQTVLSEISSIVE
ncbi:MAG: hypothetical protein JSS27_13960 [Planctomycetes bacterium]|nr:hypothetical protein [Planctomycetota bacterium]